MVEVVGREYGLQLTRMSEASSSTSDAGFRAGICAIVGLPNVGKSTLLNGLIGERLSIVTHKAQTTRQRLLGIYSDDAHQAVFVDTPGLLEPRYPLHEAMQAEVGRATSDADVLVYVVDVGWPPSVEHVRSFQPPAEVPAVLCLNKSDRSSGQDLATLRVRLADSGAWTAIVATQAVSGRGVDDLRSTILSVLPRHPPYYPVDQIATAPLRFFAAELIRETCFEELQEELPYATAVEVESFREAEDPVYIEARIHVERESQKGMVIGKGGRMIRSIGSTSRQKIEKLLERRVYLDLRVTVKPNWRRSPGQLKLFGYDLPPARGE
jgi:GTP-binding protein Era